MTAHAVGASRPDVDTRWLVLSVVLLAPLLGATAVVAPAVAVVLIAGLLFTAIALHNLAAGVALFTIIAFLETLPAVAGPGTGAVKAAGVILVLAALRHSGAPFLLKEQSVLAYGAGFLAAWALASALWAEDMSVAARDGLRLLLGVALVFIVFAAVRSARHARWVVWGYLGGATAAALVGLVQPGDSESGRLAGGLGDPNFLAAMLVPALVFSIFGLAWTTQPTLRWLLAALALLFTVALFLTHSRGGLAALGVALLAGLLFGGSVRRQFAVIIVGVAVIGGLYYGAFAPADAQYRLTSPGGGSGRTDLWSVATEMIGDHPVLGVGGGNFTLVAPRYVTEDVNLPSVHLVVDTPQEAHNTYLGVFAELGVVGFLALVGFVLVSLALVRRSTKVFSEASEQELELVSRAVLVGLVGMLAAFFFLSGENEKQLWLLLGLAIALHGLATRHARTPGSPAAARSGNVPERSRGTRSA